jgi:ABC-2 type transport system ATP-binding protein
LYGMNVQACRVRINELLEKFGLAEAGRKRLGEYSKGMRQKLALVRALLHNPPVLLLDEPTSAMDPESARLVRDSIRSLRDKDRTVLLCTHNLVEAEELADKVAFIRRGQIILNDTLANLKLKLLGPVEYEANLAQAVDGWSSSLPEGVSLTSSGSSSLRFRVQNPQVSNPILIQQMVDAHLDVISFQEVPHTLEQAYLAANTHLSELEKTNRV